MKDFLERCWYGRCRYSLLLVPFSLIFFLLVAGRRLAYRAGLFRVRRLPVPVIVVGNLGVGGSGKTPLTLCIVQWLAELGYHPGIISRGYGGCARAPMPVQADSDPALVGDEPVLLARRAACPVWIGRKRAEAGRQLLAFHSEVDVLVADDGLQHYALVRDMEIVVVDGLRGFGNGRLLPAGPLREPLGRLATVDAAVVNGGDPDDFLLLPPSFAMRLRGATFRNLRDPAQTAVAADFAGHEIHALAGIGHPQRFFDHLEHLGLNITPHVFPDHHAYSADDLPAGTLLMTEKDAVKCAPFASPDAWFLAVDAILSPGLKTLINHTLKARHGPQTA
ncbi:MAG: tetraacyldisaccharide 4'-kinase [Pseudomonadota bacterium]|nr:tetraacyldisaccharide 4'-kinase [Pseudomonadota bacterium]